MKKQIFSPDDSSGLHGEFRDLDMSVCSLGDCTGLIPALPQNEDEIAAYEDLYPYLPQAPNSAAEKSSPSSAQKQND